MLEACFLVPRCILKSHFSSSKMQGMHLKPLFYCLEMIGLHLKNTFSYSEMQNYHLENLFLHYEIQDYHLKNLFSHYEIQDQHLKNTFSYSKMKGYHLIYSILVLRCILTQIRDWFPSPFPTYPTDNYLYSKILISKQNISPSLIIVI